jgi:hypothetical protein
MATYLPNVTDVLPQPALYTPDYSFLDSMLRRRQGLYEQGFAQVSNAYNFVNRNVTNPYSMNVRDQFLAQARNNLKNLAAMDLSQQQNVETARAVFDPFVKNQPVLMDMAFTAHLDQQESIAESFRLKEGGKEFSEDNLNYIRQQRAAFANDNINSVGSYYANRRSFTPYYDYYKEVQEKMKDFKPSSYKIDRINGLYKITKEDNSWREAEVSEYLNGVLSDKAKQQMRIESQVRLGGNPEALAGMYKQVAEQQREMNAYNIKEIDKNISLNKDPNVIKLLKAKKEQIEDSNREINTNLENISKGDLSYIKNNSEKLSSAIYFNSKLSGFVKSFAHEDIAVKIDADQVGLALMREDRADRRQRTALSHAEKMKRLEVDGLPGNFQTRELAEGEDGKNIEVSISRLQNDVDDKEAQMNQIRQETKQHILTRVKERDPNAKLTLNDINQAYIDKWLKTGGTGGKAVSKTDPYYINLDRLSQLNAMQSVSKNKLKSIETAATQGMSESDKKIVNQIDQKLNSLGSIRLDDGTNISAKQLATGLKNGTVTASMNFSGDAGSIKINGKVYNVQDRIAGKAATRMQSNVGLLSAYNQIKGIQSQGGDTYSKFLKNRQEYIDRNFASLRMTNKVVSFDADSPNAKSLEGSASTYLPSGYDFKHAGVGATSSNQGNAYFYITPKGDSKESPEDIANKLTAGGAKVRVIKTEKGPAIFEIQGLNNRVANQFRQYSPLEGAVINEMQSYSGVRDYASSPFTTPYGDTRFIIKKSGNFYYLHINGFGESYPDAFSSPVEAISMARLLSANGGSGAKMFEKEASGTSSPSLDVSGLDYDYRYE